jgi:hypothetical protein
VETFKILPLIFRHLQLLPSSSSESRVRQAPESYRNVIRAIAADIDPSNADNAANAAAILCAMDDPAGFAELNPQISPDKSRLEGFAC